MQFISFILISTFLFLVGCSSDGNSDNSSEGPPVPDLNAFLDENPTLKSSIRLEDQASVTYFWGGTLSETSYDDWSEEDKLALEEAFRRAWINLYISRSSTATGSEEFAMPLACIDCEERLVSSPNNPPFTTVTEDLSKRAYIAHVAHSLALETGTGLEWSIASSTEAELYHYFNSRAMMFRLTGNSEDFFFGYAGSPGTERGHYIGRGTPATPIYTYWWFINNDLLQSTREETIYAVLDWFRLNAIHYYGSSSLTNMNDHWGYPSQPPANAVMAGSTLAGESEDQHWTAGCHGTTGFIKSVLKTMNIPAEVIYTCGHAQLYFPTLDRYLIHGDDPYNADVKNQPLKDISGLLIDSAIYTGLFGANPDFLPNAHPNCANMGYGTDNF